MDQVAYLDVVVAQTRALADAARVVGPDTTVPATPEWTMAKLVKHCGTTHAWARAVIERGEFANPGELDLGLPAAESDYPDWIEAGAGAFVATAAGDGLLAGMTSSRAIGANLGDRAPACRGHSDPRPFSAPPCTRTIQRPIRLNDG